MIWEDLTRDSVVLTPIEVARFNEFVTKGYEKARLKHEVSDLKLQQEYIENFVQKVRRKLGELYPIFKVRDVLGNGSFYHDAKILNPDEFDFLIILETISRNVKVLDKKSNRKRIKIVDEEMVLDLQKLSEGLINMNRVPVQSTRQEKDGTYLSKQVVFLFHRAITKTLSELDDVNLKNSPIIGPCDAFESVIDRLKDLTHQDKIFDKTYTSMFHEVVTRQLGFTRSFVNPLKRSYKHGVSFGEVFIAENPHGPCVTLRIGGPLCAADVDLGFCIEKERTEMGRNVLLPSMKSLGDEWMLSYSEDPGKLRINKGHRKIQALLKFLFIEYQLLDKFVYNSHSLKTVVMYHQDRCNTKLHEPSLGECLVDIMFHIFELYQVKIQNNPKCITITRTPSVLPDFDFKENKFTSPVSHIDISTTPALSLYGIYRILKLNLCSIQDFYKVDRWTLIAELTRQFEDKRSGLTEDGPNVIIPLETIDNALTKLYKTQSD